MLWIRIEALRGRLLSWHRMPIALLLLLLAPAASAGSVGDPDEVFQDRFESGVQQLEQITQYGITWTFDRAYPAGQFVTGDWWVVGPVTIIGIDPPSLDVAGRIQHGAMLNPMPAGAQGFDNQAEFQYSNTVNVAFNVSAEDPLVIDAVSSLVSSITANQPQRAPQLDDAAVLTVVDAVPPQGSFRPPYAGVDKAVRSTSMT